MSGPKKMTELSPEERNKLYENLDTNTFDFLYENQDSVVSPSKRVYLEYEKKRRDEELEGQEEEQEEEEQGGEELDMEEELEDMNDDKSPVEESVSRFLTRKSPKEEEDIDALIKRVVLPASMPDDDVGNRLKRTHLSPEKTAARLLKLKRIFKPSALIASTSFVTYLTAYVWKTFVTKYSRDQWQTLLKSPPAFQKIVKLYWQDTWKNAAAGYHNLMTGLGTYYAYDVCRKLVKEIQSIVSIAWLLGNAFVMFGLQAFSLIYYPLKFIMSIILRLSLFVFRANMGIVKNTLGLFGESLILGVVVLLMYQSYQEKSEAYEYREREALEAQRNLLDTYDRYERNLEFDKKVARDHSEWYNIQRQKLKEKKDYESVFRGISRPPGGGRL